VPMAEETANALHVGIGVAATCIGVACSVYHCCCRVWRRLKGYTPTATVGAVAAAGLMAAGQLSSVTTVGPPPNRGDAVPGTSASCRDAPQEPGNCQPAEAPRCSSTSGPQESGDCQPEAQPRCSPTNGTQTVRWLLFSLISLKNTILAVFDGTFQCCSIIIFPACSLSVVFVRRKKYAGVS
jgi:hypothetical protein